MKNSLRIHKWTHNEFNIFILGVLTHPHRDFTVTATPFGYHGKKTWPKSRRRRCQRAEGYPFSALFAPVSKC